MLFLMLSFFIEISLLNTNSVDSEQALCSVAADLGQRCLSVTLI